MTLSATVCLLIALLLDKRFGDPDRVWSNIPHPVVLFGKIISVADQRLKSDRRTRWAGIIFVAICCLILGVVGFLPSLVTGGELLEILIAAVLISHKSLLDHVQDVANQLRISISHGRLAVAKIVGRDVSESDVSEVSKAAIESAAEGFSDGVIAPCFWFLLFGLPGIIVYKFVNTADSMIGYRNERYSEFGWCAARFDDLLNWVPSRISAVLLLTAHGSLDRFGRMAADAPMHVSPNAGWPEAATAHALGIVLGGPRDYNGESLDLRFFNGSGRQQLMPNDIDDTIWLVRKTHRIVLILIAALVGVHLILL